MTLGRMLCSLGVINREKRKTKLGKVYIPIIWEAEAKGLHSKTCQRGCVNWNLGFKDFSSMCEALNLIPRTEK